MTFEQIILELIRIAGVPGVIAITIAGIFLLRSRSNMIDATASSHEARAQASIARDNAEVVKTMALQSDEERKILMSHVLDSQQQVVELTTLIGDVRLDLTEKINIVTVKNAKLDTEIVLRREFELFLKESVVTELKVITKDIKGLINDRRKEDSADRSSVESSPVKDTESESDNIQRKPDESISKVRVSGGGSSP